MLKHLIGSLLFLSALSHADVVRLVGSTPLDTVDIDVTGVWLHDAMRNPSGGWYVDYGISTGRVTIASLINSSLDSVWVRDKTLGFSDDIPYIDWFQVPINGGASYDLTGPHGYGILFALRQADGQTFYSDPRLNSDLQWHVTQLTGGLNETPEPASAALIGGGLLVLWVGMRKRPAR